VRRHLTAGDRGDDGIVTVLVAMAMAMVMAATALSVDVGRVIDRNRSLQAIADAVALDAATALDGAPASQVSAAVDQEAAYAAGRNGFSVAGAGGPSGNGLTVTLGQWNPQQATFTPLTNDSPSIPNAVRVQPASDISYVLSMGTGALSRSATAYLMQPPANLDSCTANCAPPPPPPPPGPTFQALAGFTLGSYLASVDSSQVGVKVLNALLSKLGTAATVSAVGYQGLATSSIELGDLLAADTSVGSLSNLLSASFPAKTLLDDLATALGARATRLLAEGNAPAAATLQAADATVNSLAAGVTVNTIVALCQLVNVGGSCSPSDPSAASAAVDVLSMVTGIAEVADGASGVRVDLGIGQPVTVSAAVIQPQVTAPPSPVGTTLSTSQVNVSIAVGLVGASLTVTSSGASARAQLETIACDAPQATTYAVSTEAGQVGATLAAAGVSYQAQATLSGASAPATFDAPWTPGDGQFVATESPTIGLSFSGTAAPALVANEANAVLGQLDPYLPDILSTLGAGVAGAHLVSWPTECAVPMLVS